MRKWKNFEKKYLPPCSDLLGVVQPSSKLKDESPNISAVKEALEKVEEVEQVEEVEEVEEVQEDLYDVQNDYYSDDSTEESEEPQAEGQEELIMGDGK